MDDAILAENYDEDYCLGCESGVDASDAHSKKCQHQNYYGTEKNDDEDYCYGCESGVDCPEAHTEKCKNINKD